MKNILSRFDFGSPIVSCEPFGEGHINRSFLAVSETGEKFVVQGINTYVFKDVPGLMDNAVAVSEHIRRKTNTPGTYLEYIKTVDGRYYCEADDGSFWRSYRYIGDCVCLQSPESPDDFYQSAVAFGTLQAQMADFPAEELCEVLPDFHNTPVRVENLRRAIENDRSGRAGEAEDEIAFALARAGEADCLTKQLASGELPLRVTHNDTKLNNVLLYADTRRPKCVIDMDTIMPGLPAIDFGDSIRFGASTAAEDEKDLSRVSLDLELYRVYLRGFVRSCPSLTENERRSLPLGAKVMCYENGVRFLTDFIDGDVYFHTKYPTHNLDRTRTQFKLVADIEAHWDEMLQILDEECKACDKDKGI